MSDQLSSHCTTKIVLLALFFAVGLVLASKIHGPFSKLGQEVSNCKMQAEVPEGDLPGVSIGYQDELYTDIGTESYSCNAARGYEELSRLHQRSIALTRRRDKGEANRDRTATIARKQSNAMAAENAFRGCLNGLMPELLTKWDEDLKSGRLKRNSWDDRSEKDIGGITYAVLEDTADSF